MMNDTHPEAERVWIEAIRRLPMERRAALASALRNRTYWLARRAIERAHPHMSVVQQKLLFIKTHYGEELAGRVKDHWPNADAIRA